VQFGEGTPTLWGDQGQGVLSPEARRGCRATTQTSQRQLFAFGDAATGALAPELAMTATVAAAELKLSVATTAQTERIQRREQRFVMDPRIGAVSHAS
jgi:hypothetical protein